MLVMNFVSGLFSLSYAALVVTRLLNLGNLLVVFSLAQLFNPLLLRVEDKEYLEHLAVKAATGD